MIGLATLTLLSLIKSVACYFRRLNGTLYFPTNATETYNKLLLLVRFIARLVVISSVLTLLIAVVSIVI